MEKLTGFEDSRPRHRKGEVRTPRGNATPMFCVSCGKLDGYALTDTTHIVGLCDECFDRFGGLDLPAVPKETVEGKKEVG